MNENKFAPSEETKFMSKYVAMAVRNAMEDFHVLHLSNAQMAELNPIVRNAICSAIHAVKNQDRYLNAKLFVDRSVKMIPSYWEEPDIDPTLKCEAGMEDMELEPATSHREPREVRVAESRLVTDVAVTVGDIGCSSHDPVVNLFLEVFFADGFTAEVEMHDLQRGGTLYWEVDELDEIEAMEREGEQGEHTSRDE